MRIPPIISIWLVSLIVCVHTHITWAESDSGARRPKKLALLVGINRYKWSNGDTFKDLQGSINDVKAIKRLLENRFDFSPENIHTLIDKEATHDAILTAFDEFLIKQAETNDIVLFFYSGHGSRVVDDSGDEEDQFDETIVPYDSRDPNGKFFDIRDDDIYRVLVELSRMKCYTMVFLDSCHSGSGARGDAQPRWIPYDKRAPGDKTGTEVEGETGNGIQSFLPVLPHSHYIAIAATTDESKAFEIQKGKEFYGAFSLALINALENMPKDITYRELMISIRNQMQVIMPSQKPQYEGDIYGKIFNGFVNVKEVALHTSRITETKVKLAAGSVQNVTEGSEFKLFRRGKAGSDDTSDFLGKVLIKNVYADTSIGDIIESRRYFNEADAIEFAHNYKDLKIQVWIGDSEKPNFIALKNIIKEIPVVHTVKMGDYYNLKIYEEGGLIKVQNYDGSRLGKDVSLNSHGVSDEVAGRIYKLAKYRAIQALSNRKSKLKTRIDLIKIKTDEKGNKREIPARRFSRNGEILIHPGEKILFEITNESPYGQDCYVYLFYMDMDYKVQLIYPPLGSRSNLLKNGEKVRTRVGSVKHKLGRRDIFKVITTTRPVNVATLQQTGIDRRVFNSELEHLLYEALTGTRDPGDNLLPTVDWGTNSIATYTVEEKK